MHDELYETILRFLQGVGPSPDRSHERGHRPAELVRLGLHEAFGALREAAELLPVLRGELRVEDLGTSPALHAIFLYM